MFFAVVHWPAVSAGFYFSIPKIFFLSAFPPALCVNKQILRFLFCPCKNILPFLLHCNCVPSGRTTRASSIHNYMQHQHFLPALLPYFLNNFSQFVPGPELPP